MSNIDMRIAFVVGKGGDIYPHSIRSRKAPKWLKEGVKPFEDYINQEDGTVPSDVAMAAYLNYNHPRDTIGLIHGGIPSNISTRVFNLFDVIFVIYDAIEIFHCGEGKGTCPSLRKRFEGVVRRTTAIVYPYPSFHKYIINKSRYYNDLRRAKVPVVPFLSITPKTAIKDIKRLRERIEKKGWRGVILKPSYAGYSMGIKVVKNLSRTSDATLKKYFQNLESKGFPSAVIQEFVPSFSTNYEIRTYWIDQKYAYSVATLTEAVGTGDGLPISGFDTFKSEGGTIPDTIKDKLTAVAPKVFSSILKFPMRHPLVRIDFGCCYESRNNCEAYFVNEVETMAANLLADHTKYPAVERIADAAYRFSKRVYIATRVSERCKRTLKGTRVKNPRQLPIKNIPCKKNK